MRPPPPTAGSRYIVFPPFDEAADQQPDDCDELQLACEHLDHNGEGRVRLGSRRRSRLKPAPGWKFRTKVLEQDLVLTADNGAVSITQDELGNTYDRVGGPYSSYKP